MNSRNRNPAKPWPAWPRVSEKGLAAVQGILAAGRWAITRDWGGINSQEQEFARRFASYLEVPHCVPTANGSSALTIALEALDIGFGDEVIIPGLTWVANATAILRVNAIPVLVDIDPLTLCIQPEGILAAITTRTRAICVVHLYTSMANMDAILEIAHERGLAVIEDCAQSHGARWAGESAGSLGTIGTFSFHESKVLTSGEGGAVVTSDHRLATRLEQLRADGRFLSPQRLELGEMELYEPGDIQGANYCMTEVSAALLLDGLNRIEEENRARASAAAWLDVVLSELPGIIPILCYPAQTARTYYHYVVRIDTTYLGLQDVRDIAVDLSRRLHLVVGVVYPPLNANRLYKPWTKASTRINEAYSNAICFGRYALPCAEEAHRQCLAFEHRVLLGDDEDLEDIANAFRQLWQERGWISSLNGN